MVAGHQNTVCHCGFHWRTSWCGRERWIN